MLPSWTALFSEFDRVVNTGTLKRTMIQVGGCAIGSDDFVVMAGPCSVESERQILETAEYVSACGAQILRGGAYKPRTSPYAFQGLGPEGLKLLKKARERTGLAIVTEVMSETDVELVAEYADIVQVGSRSMENTVLLEAVGRCGKPILLKRGMCASLQEYLAAAQCVMESGNPEVILCERGIRTFEKATRNTLDIAAVPVLKQVTHLPVIVDPSHGCGVREVVPALARAALVAGADGLIVEVHPDPGRALSDGDQSLTFEQFRSMMTDLERYLPLQARNGFQCVCHTGSGD